MDAKASAALGAPTILHRRRALLLAAVVIAAWLPFDLLRPARAQLAFGTRALWALAVLCVAVLQRTSRPRAALRATQAGAAASAAAAVVLVWSQGGARGPFFGFLVALPLALLGFVPHMISTAVYAGTITTVAGVAMNVEAGYPLAVTVEWAAISVALVSLGTMGIVANRELLRQHSELERQQARAAIALADSERRRARAERLAVVGQLASGVAHEINNPLAYVKSSLACLRNDSTSEAERREAIDDALDGVTRIAQIVLDLRAFGRAAPEDVEDCAIPDVVEEALRIASARISTARVIRKIQPGTLQARTVRRWLVQALVNLLANAADALEAVAPERRWIRVDLRQSAGEVSVTVEDGGPGIPEEVAARLFEPFFTTKGEKGTGLGLALTREQVERSGGRIEVGRAAEGGARLTICLPALPTVACPMGNAQLTGVAGPRGRS